ncbi:hypothetical protein JAAARDRAFT_339126 [Jaapia argillacea MUCL 33604]|uniref:Uncharacterized protein n=1 Tax=Jaapia argillacea MUCL 33604 TaxID=933084 RepID=A0A067PKW2_9AGAM|nr:hypothetical protein JAAARDRAFT_339126 [Jaapia argillacea MUCL 33604]
MPMVDISKTTFSPKRSKQPEKIPSVSKLLPSDTSSLKQEVILSSSRKNTLTLPVLFENPTNLTVISGYR